MNLQMRSRMLRSSSHHHTTTRAAILRGRRSPPPGASIGFRELTLTLLLRRSPVLRHMVKAAQALFAAQRRTWWRLRRGGVVRSYLSGQAITKLQIGTGANPIPGWLNTDLNPTQADRSEGHVIFLDATRQFPFADATFDYIYLEHMIANVPYSAGRRLLTECARVLRPGGRIRIATPDLTRLLDLYQNRNDPDPEEQAYIQWIADTFLDGPRHATPQFVVNNAFRAWGHHFHYDEELLQSSLRESGFVAIRRREVGQSEDPHLRNVEGHGRAVGSEAMNAFETLVLEGSVPDFEKARR